MKNVVNNLVAVIALSTMLSTNVNADDSNYIEEILVIGAVTTEDITDVSLDFTISETLMPAVSYIPGGYGGFAGYSERGTQTIHTTVYKNGVPANDAGNGWYDFSHDVVTGTESVKVVNGPNSVLYGSGSLGGTVFITDQMKDMSVLRIGEQHTLASVSLFESLSISHFNVNNGSVRNDNTEDDWYKNNTVKFVKSFDDLTVAAVRTDYEYDYDNCYTPAFSTSNDCQQDGQKTDLSIRNNNFTLGYSRTDSEFFTEGASTYTSKAERYYADAKKEMSLSESVTYITGVTLQQDKYSGDSRNDFSTYSTVTVYEKLQGGLRVSQDAIVGRLGYTTDNYFVSIGNTYRNPTMYQEKGDAWVQENPNLDPEKGMGIEAGYKAFSVFKFKFDENIDYSYANSQYVNTGEYDTQGIRFMDMFAVPYGSFNVLVGYTDSDQPRVPKWKTRLSYFASVGNYSGELVYTAQFDRGMDIAPYGQEATELVDLESVDLVFGLKEFDNGLKLDLTVQNLFDKEVEVISGYDAGGRNIFLTLTYK
jgi:outer membrane cobalamin receptor